VQMLDKGIHDATTPPLRAGPPLHCALMYPRQRILHCRQCGAPVHYRIPAQDNRERAVCTACETIHYENPLNVVGTVPIWSGRDAEPEVLLCRRAIEPRRGYWTLPAGFMELGETTEQGALRETTEEAGARVELQGLFSVLSVARVGQVHLFYRARLVDTRFDPGEESLEVQLFRQPDLPWDEIAFRTVRETLQFYFADHRRGRFDVHCLDIS